MKKTKKSQVKILFIASSLVVLIGFVGCSKDDGLSPVGCNNWSEKYLSQAQAYSDASAAYSNDPSVTNCNKLKTEGLNYVKSLEGILSCVPTVNKSEFNNDIKELKAEINSTACDQ
ncbi:hypothetical protein DHD32_10790 [Arenibacter sp. TNZ]|jgi:hypothetical protein|uniref:hypothetical protein n=1 Tax=Arenibacter TaxID=178469 RepID=UPI000CD42C82|nr:MULTISPECIES: hypothetical protein [Arenibacter]MCM4171970.1 hypothetical protein [Arenibacter sp. TNZ]